MHYLTRFGNDIVVVLLKEMHVKTNAVIPHSSSFYPIKIFGKCTKEIF